MEATAFGLEVFVRISQEEMDDLLKSPLCGIMKFRDNHNSVKRDISFSIEYSPNQRRLIEKNQEPRDVYFGDAEEINFYINKEYYDSVKEDDAFGERFSIGGKLVMKVIQYKTL